MMDRRNQKKFVIGLIYGAIVLALILWVYFALRPDPTCTDGKQNQNETGIDCGGVCGACVENPSVDAIDVAEATWVPSGKPGRYDFLAKISNPNNDFGASSFSYTFRALDSTGNALSEFSDTAFILPRDNRYLLKTNVSLTADPSRVELVISDTKWERLSNYQEKPPINIYNRQYNRISSGVGFGKATGLVVNESAYDFDSVRLFVVLRDSSGKPLAVQESEMRTLKSGEQRDFTLVWPDSFWGDVTRVEVEAAANVYRSDTFIRQYLPAGATRPFQDLKR